jgi:hypothetical protein
MQLLLNFHFLYKIYSLFIMIYNYIPMLHHSFSTHINLKLNHDKNQQFQDDYHLNIFHVNPKLFHSSLLITRNLIVLNKYPPCLST